MAIDSSALTVSSSPATTPSPQARSPDSGFGPVAPEQRADSDPNAGAASGANGQAATVDPASTGSSGSNPGSSPAGSPGGTAAGQKTGPAAQTRSVRTSGRARMQAPGTVGSPSAPAAPDAGNDTGGDFGSVMASTLGRRATGSPDAEPTTKPSSGPDDSSASAKPARPETVPTDAVAWIAQVMMTPGAAQVATAPAAVDATNGAAGGRVGAAGAKAAARTGLPAALATPTLDAVEIPTAETVAGATAATAAPTADTPLGANVRAMADLQNRISGLTRESSTSHADGGVVATTPATHGLAAGSGPDAAQAAAAVQASALTRAGTGLQTPTLSIQATVGSAAFAAEIGSRVTGLAQAGITQAQLQLNPTDLGPVQVHITLQSGQASVWFGATHSETRAALEQSLPQLREMFAGAGLPLSDSGVFREPPQQQPAQSLPAPDAAQARGSETAATASAAPVAHLRLALLDTYA